MKKNKQIAKQNTFTEFLLYTAPSGKVKVEIFLRDETFGDRDERGLFM